MENWEYIAIEGVIGVGKTTLAKFLSREYSAKLILEDIDGNPFLHQFYEDTERYAFPTQIFFLLSLREDRFNGLMGSGINHHNQSSITIKKLA